MDSTMLTVIGIDDLYRHLLGAPAQGGQPGPG